MVVPIPGAMSTETTYVLRSSSTGEAKVFGGFPGIWTVGEPKTAADLGLSDADVVAAIEAQGLPIDVVKAKPERPKPPAAKDEGS